MKLTKGTRYICVKDVVMDSGAVAYIKGKVYIAKNESVMVDEQGYDHHWTDADMFVEHFRVVDDINISANFAKDKIEKLLEYDADGHREIDRLDDWALRGVITDLYNMLTDGYDDGKKRVFTIYSNGYDWWTKLNVMARNSHNGIYENCSDVGKVTIVLFDWRTAEFDEWLVEQEMSNTDWSNKVEEYTLYTESCELVGFVYSEKK